MSQEKINELTAKKPFAIDVDSYPTGLRYPIKISGVVSHTVVGLYRGKDITFRLKDILQLERLGDTIKQISEEGLLARLTEGSVFLVCELRSNENGSRGVSKPLHLKAVALTLDTHIFN